ALRAKVGAQPPPPELEAALADLADEEALFRRLLARIADAAQPLLEIPLDERMTGRVRRADTERFVAEGTLAAPAGAAGAAAGTFEIARAWAELPPIQLYQQFYCALGLSGAENLPVAGFLWNHGLEGEATALLARIRRGGGPAIAAVDALLARRRGIPVPAGGFVEVAGRLLTPEERDTEARKREADKRRAHEAEEAAKLATAGEQAGRLLERADAAEREQEFVLARSILAAVAARFPETPEGKKAKQRLASPVVGVVPLAEGGRKENRFDLAILGDGYTLEQQDSFLKQARQISEKLFREEPFKEYEEFFNVRAVAVESAESGFDITPGTTQKNTALGGGSAYDLMVVDHAQVQRALRGLPNDGLAIVLINGGGTTGTGGGGVLAMGSAAAGILHHEIGHAMAGLGDEYETKVGAAAIGASSESKKNRPGFSLVNGQWVRTQELPARALAANLMEGSNEAAMKALCPWKHWIEKGQDNWRSRGMQEVGLFEGGGMKTHDVWRPQRDCRMRDASLDYCVACMERMVLAMYRAVRGIDAWEPATEAVAVLASKPCHFSVTTIAPRTHALEVAWTYKAEELREAKPGETVAAETPGKPLPGGVAQGKDGERVYFCDVAAGALAPGRWEVTATAVDRTGYVLLDPDQRLRATRTWRVEIK
ncbi:MAG: hypothetical protein HZA54_08325, partial [Planctomycetes bacterium]|nr:hypothetical protein [Planctomycetota bacterium]